MHDSFCDASLAQPGTTEAEDIAVFFDEAATEKFLDHARIKLGSCGEVESFQALDHSEARTFEAALQSPGLPGVDL